MRQLKTYIQGGGSNNTPRWRYSGMFKIFHSRLWYGSCCCMIFVIIVVKNQKFVKIVVKTVVSWRFVKIVVKNAVIWRLSKLLSKLVILKFCQNW